MSKMVVLVGGKTAQRQDRKRKIINNQRLSKKLRPEADFDKML